MREIAIIHTNKDTDISENILKKLPMEDVVTVFTNTDDDFLCTANVKTVKIPEELKERGASIKNFVTKHYFDNGFKGFLHVIEDSVEILKDTVEFQDKIEEMMTKLNLRHWFNTSTDVCNYTFKVFNPRMFVEIDKEDAKKVYDKKVYWTSHSNTSWVCYDYSKATYDDIKFNDDFSIAMFYIIEFLARNRNTKKENELYYMNFYPTIEEEQGVFRLSPEKWPPEKKTESETKEEQQRYAKENMIFQSLNVNNQSDMSVERIIEDMYAVLMKNN